MIVKVLSAGIREKFYLLCVSVRACVQERDMLNWQRMLAMLYSDNTSVTPFREKQSERDLHWHYFFLT